MTASTAASPVRPPQDRQAPSLADFALIQGVDLDKLPPHQRYRPLTRAIWAALMLDVATLRAFVSRATEPRTERTSGSPVDDSKPGRPRALDVIAARLVLKAIDGDTRACELVADRIEGKVGTRRDETEDRDSSRREEMASLIESIVTALTNQRLGRPVDMTVLDG